MGYIGNDRFGNETCTVTLYDKKHKGYPVGYQKIGSQLYKIEFSRADTSKPNRKGEERMGYVKLTKVKGKNGMGVKRRTF